MQGTAYKWLLFGQCSCSLGKTKGFVHLFLCWLFFPQRLLFRGPPSDLPLVYKHMSFTSSTLLFSAGGSCYRRRHFTPNGQVVSQKANGIIYRIVRKKTLQSESLLRILTSCCQPREGNPSWMESCAPLSACLFSHLEERCSADCPCFCLILWYLSDDMLVSLLLLRFIIFAFLNLIRALNR